MKIAIILILLGGNLLYSQQEMFINSEWRVTKKWIGADTVILERDSFPEFKGLDEASEREIFDNYWRSERIYFDDTGELKDHYVYVFCPVGEDKVELISFKINNQKAILKMKITKWDTQLSLIKTYVYRVTPLDNNKVQLFR